MFSDYGMFKFLYVFAEMAACVPNMIFEMLFIQKKRPELNTQADIISAKLFV